MPPIARIDAGALRLTLRPAVVCRELSWGSRPTFYLSIYDDEIDERTDAWLRALGRRDGASAPADPDALGSRLEPTDAVIAPAADGRIVVARGGCCTFPLYWRRVGTHIEVSTSLPIGARPTLSAAGLVKAAAAVNLCSSYEPNAWLETPLAGWCRLRRGAVTVLAADAAVRETPILHVGSGDVDAETVTRNVRAAFDAYGATQRRVASSIVELSGGFDSTLAAAAALRPGHRMHGVSTAFRYYEFRFEEPVQQAVARSLGVTRTVVDGEATFPYTPAARPVRLDEPAVFVTGIRQAELFGELAAERGATRIYNGIGGDQLFSTDLTELETFAPRRPSCGPFSRAAWRTMRRAADEIRSAVPLRDRRAATFVYDARVDVWIKETFGAVQRSPFTDLAVFHAAEAWSRHCHARGGRPDKRVLVDAAGDWLPDEVVNRRGKVAYDGVWMRAYAANLEPIASAFERVAGVLARIGLSPAWLIRRAEALAAWRPFSDREVLAAYAIAVWLAAWGIEREGDAAWAD